MTILESIKHRLQDNITWIRRGRENKWFGGFPSRILYADAEGGQKLQRITIPSNQI